MAKITHYDQADVWSPQATFTVSGTPTDPTTVTFKVKDPTGTITTVGPVAGATGGSGIIRDSVGVFHYDVTLNAVGYWYGRFEGTGAATAAEDQQAIVDPSPFTLNAGLSTRALVGLAETKDWLQQQNIQTSEDLELVRVINDVSDRIHFEANREFMVVGTNPQTRTFAVSEWTRMLDIGDLATAPTAVTILGYDWVTTIRTVTIPEITAWPLNREPWEPIRRLEFNSQTVLPLQPGYRVTVAGTWGFPAVPGNIRQACLDTIAVVMDRDVENWRQDLGTVTTAGEGGNVLTVPSGPPMVLSLPISAHAVVRRYQDQYVG